MPYKFNESRRHKIPEGQIPGDELARIRCRASTTRQPHRLADRRSGIGMACPGVQANEAVRRSTPTSPSRAGLALRLVLHQLLRQTEGALRSIADLLGLSRSASPTTPRSAPPRWRAEGLAAADRAKRAVAPADRQHGREDLWRRRVARSETRRSVPVGTGASRISRSMPIRRRSPPWK